MDQDVFSVLYACVTNRWQPTIGDPTVMGWVTVAAYFIGASACFVAGNVRMRDGKFWLWLCFLLVCLGINKQFDFQSLLTAIGRCVSQMQGWYEDRRAVQFFFILALGTFCAALLVYTLLRMARRLHRIGIAVLGFGLLLSFVAIRAVSFTHFDAFIGTDFAGIRMNWILEIGGITLVLLNAMTAIRGRRRSTA